MKNKKALLVFSHQLTENQKKELVEKYGGKEIEHLPEELQNMWSNVSIKKDYKENLKKIKEFVKENFDKGDIILIQGNWGYTYNLVKWSIEKELIPVYSYTERNVEEIKEGETVLVIGPGPIGLLAAQVAKANGAKVIITGITKDKPRLDLAKEIGIDVTVDSLVEDLREVILKETDGYGVDKIFDCSGSVFAVNNALPLIKKKGDFVQIGLFAKKMNELDQESIIQREIRYIGSRSQKPSSWNLALDLLENNKIATDKMITKIFSLEDTRNAFEAVMSGKEIKVLIKSNEDIE